MNTEEDMIGKTWRLVLGMVVLLSVGCGGSGEVQLRTKAASDFSCPEASVKLKPNDNVYLRKVEGCNKENMYRFDGETWSSPLERAAFEFSCKKAELTTTIINDHQVGVSGCGKRAVYILPPNATMWLMNSASESSDAGGKKSGPQ